MDFNTLCLEKYLKKNGKNQWEVIRPIPYLFDGVTGVIPVGFKTDICSHVPNCDWWYACVVHDWLYTLGDYIKGWSAKYAWRKEADKKLSSLMQIVSTSRLKTLWSAVYFLGVRLFGALVFWRPSQDSRPLAEKFAQLHEGYRQKSIWA